MYFIKPPDSFEINGPFSLIDIEQKLAEGEIRPDFEAVEANGQSFGKLRRSNGWRRVDRLINLEDDQWDERPGGSAIKRIQTGTNPAIQMAPQVGGQGKNYQDELLRQILANQERLVAVGYRILCGVVGIALLLVGQFLFS